MDNFYLKVNQEPKTFQLRLKSLHGSYVMGIYRLYYFEDGKPKTIQRLFSEDESGVIYIGMTEGTLFDRVSNLQKALVFNSKSDLEKPASSGHTQMGKNITAFERK